MKELPLRQSGRTLDIREMITGETMKEKNGEHPFGDAGQLILLGVFLVVWVGDSFFLRKTNFLSAGHRIKVAYFFNETTITSRAAICYNDLIKWALFRATAS